MVTLRYTEAVDGSYPTPDSDRATPSYMAETEHKISPAAGKETKSCEPAAGDTGRRVNRRHKSYTPETWESVKPEIKQLYLESGLTLKEVMVIMGEQQGFWASKKMYKTKLNQWAYFKNNRKVDVAQVVFHLQHRSAMGKESTFRRNGKAVDWKAYMRRKGLRVDELLEGVPSGDLPPTIRCRTPPPSPPSPPLPRQIQPPDDLLLQETYIEWSHGHPIVPPSASDEHLTTLDQYHRSAAIQSVELFSHGCWLFSIYKTSEGGDFCQRAFAIMDDVLRQSFAIYELMAVLSRYPLPGMNQRLWCYLAEFTTVKNDVDNKIRHVLKAFAQLAKNHSLNHNLAILQWGRQYASTHGNGTMEGKPFDYTNIQPWDMIPAGRSFNHRYSMHLGTWTVEMIPEAKVHVADGNPDPSGLRGDLLLIFGNQTKWADDRVSTAALKMLEQMPSDRPSDYLRFVCYYALAKNSRARYGDEQARGNPDHEQAIEYLQQAAKVQKTAWSPGKNYYETLTLLAKWYWEAGEEAEYMTTIQRREVECQEAFKNLRR